MLLPTGLTIDLQAKLFRGLSDPSRLAILEALREGPRTVVHIVEATGLSQPNVSYSSRPRRRTGLVTATRQGRFVSYALSDDRLTQLLCLAETLLADVAHGVCACPRYHAHSPMGRLPKLS